MGITPTIKTLPPRPPRPAKKHDNLHELFMDGLLSRCWCMCADCWRPFNKNMGKCICSRCPCRNVFFLLKDVS